VTLQGKAGQFAFTLIDGITKALNAAGAKKIADALIARIGQEVALAKNVSSAAMLGQGFGNSGIFGGMNVTPGTGGGTVFEQMQSYLGSVQSFTKDIGALRKGHLNKAIIAQLIGAGPVQGDALAQSILGSYGGIGGVNSLWAQLGTRRTRWARRRPCPSTASISPRTCGLRPPARPTSRSPSTLGAPGGSLSLTTAQIRQITAEIQAALLKQARRNNKTGLQLRGKGA